MAALLPIPILAESPRVGRVERLARLTLALASLLLAGGLLVLAEVALGSDAGTSVSGPDVMRLLHTYSEAYGWKPRPGFQGVIEGARTTINERAFRGPLPGALAAGERRIVTLGDSIAFGWGADDHDTFSSRLDAEPGLQVLNLAVEGYGVDQALLRLEREGLGYEPDVVVLHFCLANDYVDPSLPAFLYDGVTPKPFFRLRGGQLELHDRHLQRTLHQRAGAALQERFALLRRLSGTVRSAEPPTDRPHWTQTAREVLDDPGSVELALALVARMAERVQGSGARFLVVLHPNRRAFNREDPRADILARAALPGVAVLDMREHYWARGATFPEVALDAVGHLSPRGHHEVAQALRPLLGG